MELVKVGYPTLKSSKHVNCLDDQGMPICLVLQYQFVGLPTTPPSSSSPTFNGDKTRRPIRLNNVCGCIFKD